MPTPTEADVNHANTKFPESGITLAQLQQGKAIYEGNCGKCHKLFQPKNESEAEWRKVVPPMARKAKLDAESEKLVLQYVVTMATTGN